MGRNAGSRKEKIIMKKEVKVLFYNATEGDFIEIKNEVTKARRNCGKDVMTTITVEASSRVVNKLIYELDNMLYRFKGVKVSGKYFGQKEGCYFTINDGEVDIWLKEGE